jgi:hypothetical protein
MKQILVFVLFAAMMCWFMFAPIYKHILIMRQALLQKEVDYLLEIGANASHGYIGPDMIEASRMRLEERGFIPAELVYSVSTTNGNTGIHADNPVPRGEGIMLTISYPYLNVLSIDRLLGISPPEGNERLAASGMKMSEYVP